MLSTHITNHKSSKNYFYLLNLGSYRDLKKERFNYYNALSIIKMKNILYI